MSTTDDRELICLTSRSAVTDAGSVRVNIPAELLDAVDTDPDDIEDVIIRGYDDGNVEIRLP
ncbi:uncharacterized protein NP_2334A [Natronomonas pharaonis DSM 2160]|uniref:Uncharacterized protein n=1 Tax=Natronomonas pharaonis (strain ATCC 35678 / DSM 2160 / CIP 103997 / JCM 8858 / NBRC 14720 / NCIMB 2260 / Gabara) TaxID=348780 RepID=A0A1U7EW05_NATPD|nr:hypothetical protein [Natronomonas pharaonis]CAI49258.1 uncharacterized protein NP_2334A [Natronomonas pharaonis DSM 2160]